MAIPEVGFPVDGVPQTTTPRSLAAATSMDALRRPVVISSFRSGSFSMTARGKAVRSRIAHTMSKPCSALITFSWLPRCWLKTLMSRSPETFDQSVILSTTFW